MGGVNFPTLTSKSTTLGWGTRMAMQGLKPCCTQNQSVAAAAGSRALFKAKRANSIRVFLDGRDARPPQAVK